jgi:hypothetical protein
MTSHHGSQGRRKSTADGPGIQVICLVSLISMTLKGGCAEMDKEKSLFRDIDSVAQKELGCMYMGKPLCSMIQISETNYSVSRYRALVAVPAKTTSPVFWFVPPPQSGPKDQY